MLGREEKVGVGIKLYMHRINDRLKWYKPLTRTLMKPGEKMLDYSGSQ